MAGEGQQHTACVWKMLPYLEGSNGQGNVHFQIHFSEY